MRHSTAGATIGRIAAVGAAAIALLVSVAPPSMAEAPDPESPSVTADKTTNDTATDESLPVVPTESAPTPEVVAAAPGQPPTVSDISRTLVSSIDPTDIDVLADDTLQDPATTLKVLTQPRLGSVEVVPASPPAGDARALAAADRPVLRFAPAVGQPKGVFTFTYEATNSFGTTGPVTVSLDVGIPFEAPWGEQPFTIRVEVAPWSWAPEGTTVAGSTFAITYTLDGETIADFTCTATSADSPGFGRCQSFTAPPRASIRIVQTSAPGSLLLDPRVYEFPPCRLGTGSWITFCQNDEDPNFMVVGPRPETNPDDVATEEDQLVDADVLENDPVGDPAVRLAIETAPTYGKAQVIGRAASTVSRSSASPATSRLGVSAQAAPAASIAYGNQVVRYTPNAGFTGVDVLRVRVTNSNGSSVETLRVTVRDKVVAGDDALLPDTGGADARWLALGALLTAAGGVVLARRRRHASEH